MANFNVWIEKSRDKYQVRHRDKSGKRYTDYGGIESKTKAKELVKLVRERLDKNELGQVDLSLDIEELIENFLAERIVNGFEPTTLNHNRNSFAAFLKETQINKLGELTIDLIKDWKTAMTHKKLSNNSIRGRLSDLRTFLNWLVADGKITVSPFGKRMMPRKSALRIRYYTAEEWYALDKALATGDLRVRAACNLAYMCGLRKKEVIALRHDDIHYREDKVFLVVRAEVSKNKLPRSVPMDPEIISLIGSKRAGPIVGELTRCQLDHFFQMARLKAGINPRLTIHGLRHSFAKNYLQSERGNLGSLQLLLGHESIESTMIYAQFEKNYLHEGIQKVFEDRQRAMRIIENSAGQNDRLQNPQGNCRATGQNLQESGRYEQNHTDHKETMKHIVNSD